MTTRNSHRLFGKQPYEGPGRLIFWVLVDLAFLALSVYQNFYYSDHDNTAWTFLSLGFGFFWAFMLYTDLNRWYVPKE